MENKRQIFSWALYDWANSAFALVIMAGFFPIFFRDYWSAGRDSASITFSLGLANSFSSLLLVVMAPILGAIADRGSVKKRFLLLFATLGISMTVGLFWVASGHWIMAMSLYIAAALGFMGGNIFYDALLLDVSREEQFDMVSSLGFALGYLGSGLLFTFFIVMTRYPGWFGLASDTEAVRVSFLLTGLWWAVFSIPLIQFVKERKKTYAPSGLQMVRAGLHQLVDTFHHIRRLKTVMLFLLSYWLYIDGVDTIIRMAINYGRELGFGSKELLLALLITQFVGFPAALLFGKIGEKLGAKTGIYIGISVYSIVTLLAYWMNDVREFYALAITIGLVQGGIQSLSRSLYARIIPPDKAAQFFGFYNILGKFAAVIGPIMMGWVGLLTGNPRISILSLLVLFIGGGILLSKVNVQEGRRAAQAMVDRQ